jgi:AcrR family transcriptional regulator
LPSTTADRIPVTADRIPVRDRIVAAVDELARTKGWAATTMAHVADTAGVSRQTVYNEFGSRPALVEAYLLREIETLIAEVSQAVASQAADARAALRSAFELFLKLASDEPVLQVLADRAEGGELGRLLIVLGRTVALERLSPLIVATWPQVPRQDADVLVDALARLAISHAMLPSSDPHDVADAVTRMVGPFVDEIVSRPAS